jgi:hypothetical protein
MTALEYTIQNQFLRTLLGQQVPQHDVTSGMPSRGGTRIVTILPSENPRTVICLDIVYLFQNIFDYMCVVLMKKEISLKIQWLENHESC